MLFSVIIRTRNEEAWVGRCLTKIFSQKNKDFEVIVVDNKSQDETLHIVKKYPVKKIVSIDDFFPGRALNLGVAEALGKYVVSISAHCVPVYDSWLDELQSAIEYQGEEDVVAAYGRQLPISSTAPGDKRDLLNTFGLDPKVQKKDFFFHNANSIVLREWLVKYPYSDSATNVEDRIWANEMIKLGKKIVYTPEAEVYHHHGINHGNNEIRLGNVTSLIEPLYKSHSNERVLALESCPASVTVVIPSLVNNAELQTCVTYAKSSRNVSQIFVVGDSFTDLLEGTIVKFVNRNAIIDVDSLTIPELVKHIRNTVQSVEERTDYYLFLSPQYKNRPPGLIDHLILRAFQNFLDVCFVAERVYSNLWVQTSNGVYKPVDNNLSMRSHRIPQYEAIFGLGLVMSSHAARIGNLTEGHVGILETDILGLDRKKRLSDLAEA